MFFLLHSKFYLNKLAHLTNIFFRNFVKVEDTVSLLSHVAYLLSKEFPFPLTWFQFLLPLHSEVLVIVIPHNTIGDI